jgi:DNA-binding response OmpR family regulator
MSTPTPQASTSLLPPLVLLAEDDDELRRLLARRLRRAGCEVIEARTGVQLVELVAEHGIEPITPPHRAASLVISDVRMPGWSGLDALRRLRRAGVELPVILITAFGSDEIHNEAANLGAMIYDKPLDIDELATQVAELIALTR